MENTIYQLQQLFNNAVFHIPQYQRSYSWIEDPHLVAFLEDLRQQAQTIQQSPGKNYFLGTLLLHHHPEFGADGFEFHDIVDGQQRLTTSVLFVASALKLAERKTIPLDEKDILTLRRTFIQDDLTERQKLHTIQEDEPFFQSSILGTSVGTYEATNSTPSSKRLKSAQVYFQKSVDISEWSSLLKVLREARVMVYVVNNSADATQIFELQNDRGKRLTDLEALKSFLMHAVYLNAKNPEDKLWAIQSSFSRVYRTVEELEDIKGAPDEDSILSYYCVAFAKWSSNEWRNPKKLAKDAIAELTGKGVKKDVIEWIEQFVGGLVSAFDSVRVIFSKLDTLPAFSDLFILGRLAPFWPLILKTWQFDQEDVGRSRFNSVCRLMEIYAFRGYAISNMRSDGGLTTLYTKARDFLGDFPALIIELQEICEWYDINRRFLNGLDNPHIFTADKSSARYFLWKYENFLRQQIGQKQPLLSWRDYIEPKDDASRFSIEHITAQDDPLAKMDVEWKEGDSKLPFEEMALHRLGNLVLDSTSPNAAKGKSTFANKLLYFLGKSIYLSQGELGNFTDQKDVQGDPAWGIQAIKKRQNVLVNFAKTEWNPRKVSS